MEIEDAESRLGFKLPAGWVANEIMRDGELAGFTLVKENEVHAWRSPNFAGRWGTRQDIARVFGPLLAKHGSVVTAVSIGNETGHRFVTRLGFEKIGEAKGIAVYKTERIKHARL